MYHTGGNKKCILNSGWEQCEEIASDASETLYQCFELVPSI